MISKKLIWGIDKNTILSMLRAWWLILRLILAFNFKMWYNKGVVKISKGVRKLWQTLHWKKKMKK